MSIPGLRTPFGNRTTGVVAATVLVSTAALTGCTIDANTFSRTAAGALGALMPFDECADALDYLRTEATDRVGPYGLDGQGVAGGMAAGAEDGAAGRAPSAAPAPTGGYSSTNNQEVGVDEADVVKTDGRYLYTVVNGTLQVVDISGSTPRMVGELDLSTGDGGPGPYDMGPSSVQLLLDGGQLLALTSTPIWPDGPAIEEDKALRPAMPGVWLSASTILSIDVSDPTAPRETARLVVDGDYLSARLIDGVARIVTRSRPSLQFPAIDGSEPYFDPYAGSRADVEKVADAMTERNRQVIATSTIEDWLPSYRLQSGDQIEQGLLVPCNQVSHPGEFSGFATVSVLTVPLADDLGLGSPDAIGVLGDGETVYASTDRLYVVTNRWGWDDMVEGDVAGPPGLAPAPDMIQVAPAQQDVTTGIHAFDITSPNRATHVASGEVRGHILGQYALSEYDGVLRVATTVGASWGVEGAPSESWVTTLGEQDGNLVELGSVGGLGKGEQIQAVRYLGTTAYVVTFRQTDPLYTLDLSDPTNPRVTGELKITGYSAYLHPMGDDRLIGVGQEATDQGQGIGLQVALFDTSDPTAPAKLDGEVLADTYSDAEWDPHAFLYWDPTGQVMLPVQGPRESGLLVLEVDRESVTRQGIVTMSNASPEDGYATPTRSIVVGERLYTLWWTGVQANDLNTLDELGWASFR